MKITCGGSFQYDFEHHAASFHERVDVVRLSAGPADMLNCKVLTVYFENDEDQPPEEAQAAAQTAAADRQQPRDLPVRRIEARGDPITLRSPARGIYIQCKGLDYSPAPEGAIGRVLGLGPGVMQANAPDNPAAKYWVQWTREFRFEPAEHGQHVALLDGGATVRVANMGEVKANDRQATGGRLVQSGRIFAWMTPLKKAAQPAAVAVMKPVAMQNPPPVNREPGSNITWQLERVLAEGDVEIDVPQLAGSTRKLEAWVERPQASPAAGDQPPPGAVANEPPPAQRRLAPNANPSQRFDVKAGSIQIKMLPRGEEFSVSNVTLDNQAHLEELTPKPGVKPLLVDGDALHISSADSDAMRVTVVGKPAKVEAAGAILQGEKINVEKQTNHLWVAGTGRMLLPMEQDLNGRPLARRNRWTSPGRGAWIFRTPRWSSTGACGWPRNNKH